MQLSVARDESQQPWEHPTHPHTQPPPVIIVLPLDAKLQDLAMHMTAVAAEEYLGSQLMPLNVESAYENAYFRISRAQRTCELAYPQSCNQPCVSCV